MLNWTSCLEKILKIEVGNIYTHKFIGLKIVVENIEKDVILVRVVYVPFDWKRLIVGAVRAMSANALMEMFEISLEEKLDKILEE